MLYFSKTYNLKGQENCKGKRYSEKYLLCNGGSCMAKQKQKTRRLKNQGTQVKANQNYKDTVFRKLFSDKKNLLSLYNAISKNNYEDPEVLQIVTLKNAIYMEMKNDLAFVIHTDLFCLNINRHIIRICY